MLISIFLSPAVNSFSEAFNKLHNEEEQELASYTNDGKIISIFKIKIRFFKRPCNVLDTEETSKSFYSS